MEQHTLRVLIITKGDENIGMGHIMRMKALYEQLKNNDIDTKFWVNEDIPIKLMSGLDYTKVVPKEKYDFAIWDYPNITRNFLIKNKGISDKHIGFEVDDNISGEFHKVFSPNKGLGSTILNNKNVVLYNGSDYALLREEFLNYRESFKFKRQCKKITITMGGSDPFNYTEKVMEAFKNIKNKRYNINIIIGPGFHKERVRNIETSIRDVENHNIKLLINNNHMPTILSSSDLVIFSGGTTRYELSYLGVPSIALTYNEEQSEKFSYYNLKSLISLGNGKMVSISKIIDNINKLTSDYKLREKLSNTGKGIIDGKGAERIVNIIKEDFY